MKKLLSALGLLLISALPAAANFSAPYKFVNAGKTYVYLPNQSPGAVVDFKVNNTETKNVAFDTIQCGWKFFKRQETASKTLVSFTSTSGINSATATSGTAPDCNNGGWDIPVNTVIQTADGWWARGDIGYQVRTMNLVYQKSAKVTANECGFGRIGTTATRSLEAFSIAGTSYTLANLPETTKPQICKSPVTGAPKVLYQPQSGF